MVSFRIYVSSTGAVFFFAPLKNGCKLTAMNNISISVFTYVYMCFYGNTNYIIADLSALIRHTEIMEMGFGELNE